MRVLVACKRGNIAPRDRSGHCRCKDCVSFRTARSKVTRRPESLREWKRKNPDKVKAYAAKWFAANKEKRRQIERSWRERNPAAVKAMNAKAGKKWATNNKGRRNFSVRARVAAKLLRTPKWADMEAIARIYLRAAELTAATGIPHEVDHIVPLQGKTVSGLHVHNNLQILTRSENRAKQNRFDECAS